MDNEIGMTADFIFHKFSNVKKFIFNRIERPAI
jgi:hypothetical protein